MLSLLACRAGLVLTPSARQVWEQCEAKWKERFVEQEQTWKAKVAKMGDEIGGPQLIALQEENDRLWAEVAQLVGGGGLRAEVAQLVGGGGQRGRR